MEWSTSIWIESHPWAMFWGAVSVALLLQLAVLGIILVSCTRMILREVRGREPVATVTGAQRPSGDCPPADLLLWSRPLPPPPQCPVFPVDAPAHVSATLTDPELLDEEREHYVTRGADSSLVSPWWGEQDAREAEEEEQARAELRAARHRHRFARGDS